MKRNPLMTYLIWCFGLTWVCYGIRIANSYFRFADDFTNLVVSAAGAFIPTMAIAILLKKYGSIGERKTIRQFIFDFPKQPGIYGIIALFILWRLLVFIMNGNMAQAKPLYSLVPAMLIQLLFQGGFEEPGWRGFLQPYFEKKYPFIISVLLVSVIWTGWHIPLWFVSSSAQSQMSIFLFYSQILVNSCSLAAIKRITNSVTFCMLYHAWGNAIFLTIPFEMNAGIIAAYTFEAIVSITLSLVHIKKMKIAR